jgi:hypothetical protein
MSVKNTQILIISLPEDYPEKLIKSEAKCFRHTIKNRKITRNNLNIQIKEIVKLW